jgi:hypothetical protein
MAAFRLTSSALPKLKEILPCLGSNAFFLADWKSECSCRTDDAAQPSARRPAFRPLFLASAQASSAFLTFSRHRQQDPARASPRRLRRLLATTSESF